MLIKVKHKLFANRTKSVRRRGRDERWNISVRLIQRYCAQGRIDGAIKSGAAWEIPSDTKKPEDPRRKENAQTAAKTSSFQNLMPLMNTLFQPGSCQKQLASMKDGARKDIAGKLS